MLGRKVKSEIKRVLLSMLISKGCSRETASGQTAGMHEGQRHVGASGNSVPGTGDYSTAPEEGQGHASTGRTAMCSLWLKPTESVKSKKQRFL